MAVYFETKKNERRGMSLKEELFSTFLGLLVVTGSVAYILQQTQGNYVAPAKEHVIQGERIDISKFRLSEPEEIEETPIICIPVRPQDCV